MPRRSRHDKTRALKNAAQTLFANITFAAVDKPIRTIMLTSAVPNEGKSLTSISLAAAIAESGQKVLLIETDMRRRSLSHKLGITTQHGLHEILMKPSMTQQAIVKTKVPGMYFLNCEPSIPNPADLLASKKFRQFVEQASEKFDYLIFDTPPVGTFVDAAVISSIVDATIVVVRPGVVKRTDLQNARAQLEKAGAHIIGVCITGSEDNSAEYYYAYYSEDGERIDKKEAS